MVAELDSRVLALKHSTIKCGAYLKKEIREKENQRERERDKQESEGKTVTETGRETMEKGW